MQIIRQSDLECQDQSIEDQMRPYPEERSNFPWVDLDTIDRPDYRPTGRETVMRIDELTLYGRNHVTNQCKLNRMGPDVLFPALAFAARKHGDWEKTKFKVIWQKTKDGLLRPRWQVKFHCGEKDGCRIVIDGPTGYNPISAGRMRPLFGDSEYIPPTAATSFVLKITPLHKWNFDDYHSSLHHIVTALDTMGLDYGIRRIGIAFDTLDADTAHLFRSAAALKHARIGRDKAGRALLRGYVANKRKGDRGYREGIRPIEEWETYYEGSHPENNAKTAHRMDDFRPAVGQCGSGKINSIRRSEFAFHRSFNEKKGLKSDPQGTWESIVDLVPVLIEQKIGFYSLDHDRIGKRLRKEAPHLWRLWANRLKKMGPLQAKQLLTKHFHLSNEQARRYLFPIECPLPIIDGISLSDRNISLNRWGLLGAARNILDSNYYKRQAEEKRKNSAVI
jgi:hypothetical protein